MKSVDVIISFYNEEQFLDTAVRSVLAQNYQHWQIMLIDDGSTDGSTEMAKEWARRYPDKIHYLEHEGHSNKGLSASRNAAIAASDSPLIALLDADDYWMPEKLEEQVQVMSDPEIDMLCEASLYWYSWEDAGKEDVLITVGDNRKGKFPPGTLSTILYPLGTEAAPCPSGIMMTRAIWKKVRGFEEHFRGPYQMYEDQGFLGKVYLQGTVYLDPRAHNRYRIRSSSLVASVTASGKYRAVRRYFLEWFGQYITQHTEVEMDVRRAWRRAWWRIRTPFLDRFRK